MKRCVAKLCALVVFTFSWASTTHAAAGRVARLLRRVTPVAAATGMTAETTRRCEGKPGAACSPLPKAITLQPVKPDDTSVRKWTKLHVVTMPKDNSHRPDVSMLEQAGKLLIAKISVLGTPNYFEIFSQVDVDAIVKVVKMGKGECGECVEWYCVDVASGYGADGR